MISSFNHIEKFVQNHLLKAYLNKNKKKNIRNIYGNIMKIIYCLQITAFNNYSHNEFYPTISMK